MASATVGRGPVASVEREQTALAEIERLLSASDDVIPMLIGRDGQRIGVPESVMEVLRQAVHALARDRAVAVVPIQKLLTTQRAADLLGVSRPYLVRLLDAGKIPSSKTGSHRRVRLDDLLAYAKVRDERRRESLTRLTQLSQELGLYSNG